MSANEHEGMETKLEREIMQESGTEAAARLAAGKPVHVCRDDTPDGHVIRIHADRQEELVTVDHEAMALLLGR